MHRLSRLLVLCTLSLGLASATGCKRTQASSDTSPGSTGTDDSSPAKPKRARRKPGLPRPLRLPANAPIVVHIQAPGDAIAGLRAYSPQIPGGRSLLQDLVAQLPGSGEFESKLAGSVDLDRSWDAASVDGELIVYLPIIDGRVESVATLLADKPPVGRFGAVDLQRGAAAGPKLAWLDREAKALTLADTERGLATGRQLARQYGKDHPLRLQLQGAEVRKHVPQFALETLDLRGAGTHQFEAEVKGVPPELFAQLDRLQPGALTGLLESPGIAAGGSSKYTHYDRDVRKILGDVKRQVDRQSFLVKGTLQDLSRRLGSVMRSWNGRIMVGVGPKNHLLVGFGADDPKKMGGSLFHLMNGVIDNLDLARSLGISVPRVRLQRNKSQAAGSNVSAIALENARKYLPPEAAGLLNDKGDLRIGVAFTTRANAGMVAIGPNGPEVLAKWLEDVADATPGNDSTQDFVAATVAVAPAEIQSLFPDGVLDVKALLGLDATREPTRLTVVRDGDVVKLRVDGPTVGFRPRRIGAHHGGPGARARRPGAKGRAPAGGKPARTKPSSGKPIR